ncbi:Phenylpropionate dioxygenase, large terminal subunit [Pseudomonas linyingensis]|uniref:Phenylpropionate dioxygenase, large terminal subunit n=1 Tax=Pseudomonas linyingensis TaxID=915471 RepID=A0A1H7BG95_9PSED|nr:aromatic ring-hydroxylating dioxygenase subunit alpha [Pseudomonas linyingensis]SEJ76528.1 Phenylpropionate dioxygenase, large terminal subunit [Pseudomonas linyingensis]
MSEHARTTLIRTARDMLHRLDSQQIDLAPDILSVDADIYVSPERFEAEKRLLFRRLPLMLAASCELAEPNSYKAMEIAGVPVLLVRGADRQVQAFLNSCTHRGSQLAEGCGKRARFTCPYHGWTFTAEGKLLAVASARSYGDVDKGSLGLKRLPTWESAGLIWVTLDPGSTLDKPSFLGGVDQLLEGFQLDRWQLYDQRVLPGANWKLAFDAHMDFYHLPILHKNTFGPDISNLAQYYFHGPHQRLGLMSSNPVEQDGLHSLKNLQEQEWSTGALLFGEWILFPNVSLNCFIAGERIMVISQVVPGETPDSSQTIQTFLTESAPTEASEAKVRELVSFIGRVVGEEDLPMSRQQQRALSSGLMPKVQFGRNELGLQQYYHWLEQVLAASSDDDLNRLFSQPAPVTP